MLIRKNTTFNRIASGWKMCAAFAGAVPAEEVSCREAGDPVMVPVRGRVSGAEFTVCLLATTLFAL